MCSDLPDSPTRKKPPKGAVSAVSIDDATSAKLLNEARAMLSEADECSKMAQQLRENAIHILAILKAASNRLHWPS
jgi:hypothetical protein